MREMTSLGDIRTKRVCPQCRKLNDTECRICTCGHWFVTPNAILNSVMKKPGKRSLTGKWNPAKLRLTLVALVIIVVSAVTARFYFFPLSGDSSTEADTQAAALAGRPSMKTRAKNEVQATVTAVLSGDTIVALDQSGRELKVRLSDIDTVGDTAQQATENLSKLVLGKEVIIALADEGNNGLYSGKVYHDGTDVGLQQIHAGFAVGRSADGAPPPQPELASTDLLEPNVSVAGDGNPSASTPVRRSGPSGDNAEPARFPVSSETRSGGGAEIVSSASGTDPTPAGSTPIVETSAQPGVASAGENTRPNQTTIPTDAKLLDTADTFLVRCSDGAVIRRARRSGSCAGRGGVAAWLDGSSPKVKSESKGRTYMLGPRGGCFYTTASGTKSYVDKSFCKASTP